MHEIKHQTAGPKPTSPTAPPSPGVNRPTRRNFIVWALGGLLGAIVAAVTAPILVYLYPAKTAATAGTLVRIALGTPVDGIGEGGAVQFDAPANTALVMADGGGVNAAGSFTYGGYLTRVGGRLHALAITCPHLGCSYGLEPGGKRFLCPCHGSVFNLEGQVLHGPAANPLSHLTWRPGDQPDVVLVDGVNQAGCKLLLGTAPADHPPARRQPYRQQTADPRDPVPRQCEGHVGEPYVAQGHFLRQPTSVGRIGLTTMIAHSCSQLRARVTSPGRGRNPGPYLQSRFVT